MSVEKLNPDQNPEEARLQQLKSLFPEIVKDGIIDLETLKEVLGLGEDDDSVEHFGLNWAGKRQARKIATKPSQGTLIPMKGEGINEDETGNVFIEGDNLEVLKLLQKSYAGRVKMIYIDPPYNTGNDFIYPDDFKDDRTDYLQKTAQADDKGKLLTSNPKSSGRFHANWLSMMYPRLRLAKNLLTEDGVIFISIDDNEVHNLRALCNEIFGEENFIDCIVWKKRYGGGAKEKYLVTLHEYTLFYANAKDCLENIFIPLTEEAIKKYYKFQDDNYPIRGPYRTHPLEATKSMGERNNLVYPIPSPDGKEIFPIRQWLWSKERTFKALEKGELEFIKNKKDLYSVHTKQYLKDSEGNQRTTKAFSLIEDIYTQHGTNEILEMFGNAQIFSFPKPTKFIIKFLEMIATKDDIILDFFAGSCTTAQAVMELNKEDGGDRKFICVQIPEETDEKTEAYKAGYKTIAEIGKERIRRAIKKIEEELSGQIEGITAKPDLGFKVYKLDQSNLKLWQDYQGNDTQQLGIQFKEFEQPFREGWTPEKVIAEIQIMEGFPFDSVVNQASDFTTNQVTCISHPDIGHQLFICLDEALTIDTIQQVRLLEDEDRFICLDNALTDQQKVMLEDGCKVKTI